MKNCSSCIILLFCITIVVVHGIHECENECIENDQCTALCKSLQANPKDSGFWNDLAVELPREGTIKINDVILTKSDCFVKALETSTNAATTSMLWTNIGVQLNAHDRIVYRGKTYTKLDCYIQAVMAGPKDSHLWVQIGIDLSSGNSYTRLPPTVTILGVKYNAMKAFVKAIELDPSNPEAWVQLGHQILLLGDHSTAKVMGSKVSARECFTKVLSLSPMDSNAWTLLGSDLTESETVVINDKSYNRRKCFFLALEINPSDSNAWIQLSRDATSSGPFTFRGRVFNAQDCILKGIESSPKNPVAWAQMARTIPLGKTLMIWGKYYSKVDCLMKALSYPVQYVDAWKQLALAMNATQIVQVDHRNITRYDAIEKVLSQDTESAEVWEMVGTILSDPHSLKTTVSTNERTYTAFEAYGEALKREPEVARHWWNAAAVMRSHETVTVGSRTLTKKDVWTEIFRLSHNAKDQSAALCGISTILSATETIQLNGKDFRKRDALIAALELDPQRQEAWQNLGHSLLQEEGKSASVFIFEDAMSVNASQCFLKAYEVDSSPSKDGAALLDLAETLQSNNKKDFIWWNNTAYGKKELLQYVLQHHPRNPSAHLLYAKYLLDLDTLQSKKLSKQHLLEAASYSKGNSEVWTLLGKQLGPKERVVVNGKEFSKSECLRIGAEYEALQQN